MDKLGACSFFLTTLLLISSTSAVDKTIENEASGSTVVEAVVNLLRARCTVSDDNFFLRRMAYAASRDGEKSDTFRKGFDGGIWQHTHLLRFTVSTMPCYIKMSMRKKLRHTTEVAK